MVAGRTQIRIRPATMRQLFIGGGRDRRVAIRHDLLRCGVPVSRAAHRVDKPLPVVDRRLAVRMNADDIRAAAVTGIDTVRFLLGDDATATADYLEWVGQLGGGRDRVAD